MNIKWIYSIHFYNPQHYTCMSLKIFNLFVFINLNFNYVSFKLFKGVRNQRFVQFIQKKKLIGRNI